jgi:cytochrome c
MKSLFLTAILLFALSHTVFAQTGAKLAKSKNCLACHQINKKVVGPAYKDIAQKYKDDSGAITYLAMKIMQGGAGVWGPIPMPPNPQVSQAEAEQLAQWILKQK